MIEVNEYVRTNSGLIFKVNEITYDEEYKDYLNENQMKLYAKSITKAERYINTYNKKLKDDVIKKGVPNNLYGKIFKTIGSSYNAYFIVICYWILNVAKRSLGNVYLRIRKVIYKK